MVKKSTGFALASLSAVLAAGIAVFATLTIDKNSPSWLIVVTADEGEFAETGEGVYVLTLRGVHEESLAFTDRPIRQAALSNTAQFLGDWNTEFENDPPNAVVSAESETALTLISPVVAGDTVTFTVVALPGQTIPLGTTIQPTLFIDDFTLDIRPTSTIHIDAPMPGREDRPTRAPAG